MRFSIINGMPYLRAGDKAFPIKIENGSVTVDSKNSFTTDAPAGYGLSEIVAKFGDISSIPKPKRTKKEDANAVQ